jgi:hypothetical protein
MNENLTKFFRELAESTFDAGDAARILLDNFAIRTRSDELVRVVTGKADEKGISLDAYKAHARGFLGIGEDYFEQWWVGVREISREAVIKLSFFFKMNADESAQLLTGRFGYDSFYMRNFKEFIYAVCLDNGLDLACANRVINQVKMNNEDIGQTNPDVRSQSTGESATEWLKRETKGKGCFTEESLVAFVNAHADLFGTFNRAAYNEFISLYDKLRHGTSHTGIAPEHQTDIEIYEMIQLNIPAGNQIMNQTLLKIAENALGGAEDISRIKAKNPRRKVNRRLLITMWMLVNGGKPHFEEIDGEIRGDEHLDDVTDGLHGMLNKCGMPLLDPRSPFDWLILNALYYTHMVESTEEDSDDFTTDGVPEDMPERINEMITRLFYDGEYENEDAT